MADMNLYFVGGLKRTNLYDQVKGDGPPSERFSMAVKASSEDNAREHARHFMTQKTGLLITVSAVVPLTDGAIRSEEVAELIERHNFDWDAPWYTQKIVAIDLETTGLNPITDCITQVGWSTYNPKTRKFGAEKSFYVNEGSLIPQELIERGVGPTNADIKDAPPLSESHEELVDDLDGAILVIQNRGFDIGFLQRAFNQFCDYSPGPAVCTKELAHHLGHDYETHLDELVEQYGVELHQHHDAGHDAKACGDVFLAMARNVPFFRSATLRQFVRFFDMYMWPKDCV